MPDCGEKPVRPGHHDKTENEKEQADDDAPWGRRPDNAGEIEDRRRNGDGHDARKQEDRSELSHRRKNHSKRFSSTVTGVERPTLAIDGKTLRRSHDRNRGLGALHSVSVWASEFGLTLAQVATEEKSNEITAIPTLLSLVDIRGAIITIDAMGTQTAIAEKIIDGGGDFILALKGNQGTLHDATIDYIDEQAKTDFQGIGARRFDTAEKKHGRIERRTYIQMPAPKSLPGFANWKGLLSIGIAYLWCLRDGKETSEVRYFISSLPVKVKQFAHAVRSHWGIENTCHWCLDVTYREDESRIRDEHLRENFAWLNRLTLSLLKQHPDKDSVAMKRRACGWNDEYMLQVLTGTKG